MKTIETNLIGDLKQKFTGGKISALAGPISDSKKDTKEHKNTLILFGVAGSGIFVLVVGILIFIAAFIGGIFIDGQINQAEKDKQKQESELVKCSKILEDLTNEKNDLGVKSKIKDYLVSKKVNLPEILEEIRAKVPADITLINIVKNKSGLLIKGTILDNKKNSLEIISYFVVNLNRDRTENSLISNAILASVSNDGSLITFAIKTDIETKEEKDSKNEKK